MRTLSADLQSAQKAASRRPYIEVKVRGFVGYAPRPYWTRLYTGAESDDVHALATPADGSLVRLRIDGTTLYRQRVSSPGPSSDYSAWTSFRAGSRLCALAQYGSNLLACTVDDATPTQVWKAESSDNGATWGSWSLLVTAAGTVVTLAGASKSNGDTVLFFSVGATLYRLKRAGGAWDASPTAWPHTVDSITGAAASYRNDWNLVLTGTEATTLNPTVWQLLYGDGYSQAANTFSALEVITPTSAGANVVFDSPFLVNAGGLEYLAYGENYTGTGGYNRPWWAHNIGDYVNNAWREPVPFNQTANNGLALAYASPYLWATTPFGVWRADVSAPLLDLSSDLLAFRMEESPSSARATIELRNDSGKYNSPGAGSISQIKLGSEVWISPGYYRANASPGVAVGPRLYIEGWEHTAGPQDQRFILHCVGPWELLKRWRARSSYQWASGAKNVFQMARFILARVGFDYSTLSSSSQLTSLQPAFTIHPGEDGLDALRRLLDKVEDRIRFNLGGATGVWPRSSDASDYAYGGEAGPNHPILVGRYGAQAQEANYVHTLAGTVLGEALDWNSVLELYHRAAVDQDKALSTEAQADARAAATLRKAQISAVTGSILVPANVGQELYDVVSITEPRAGLSSSKRRALGILWAYSSGTGGRARFEQEITLGAP